MKLIIFEGLDGSGKTSLIKSVQQELTKQGNEGLRCSKSLDTFYFLKIL
ncbi:hypothetical protein M33023_03440 [Candidatus Phytoplasma asteris]|uniref:Thymidylate kinase n=1 Tax=Candidatus Phytoplasma asteris TaxID=85620 RepID=A0ABZ2YF27_9MOLU